jgi:uncharacterized protein YecT (DUF1311 family)
MKKLILVFLLLTSTLGAQTVDLNVTVPDNIQTTAGMIDWAQRQLEDEEASLEKVWSQLNAQLNPGDKEGFALAQERWWSFRDLQAQADAARFDEGTIAPYVAAESKIVTTRIRTFRLRQILREIRRLGK